MYRGLHAVTRDASGGLALDGTGTPVEFLVEMRRFDEADLFDKLAKAGRLTPALMRDLADGIAEFHATSEPTPSHGGSAAIRAVIDDCRDNLRRASGIFEIERVDALHAASLAAWQGAATLLDRRRADGKVRRCHGDLHLRNICLLDGKPTLFDGIEFSDDIADIDVLYDLAFLLMDLRHREHDDLGNLVFNRYLDRTDDTGGLATGKSSLARAVAPALGPVPGARMVHTDIIRKRLAGVAPETRLPPGAYSREMNDRVYGALYAEATEALRAGYAVIVDAVSLLPAERAATAEIPRSVGVSFTGIWLEAPPELLAERIAARTGDASDATVDVLHLQLGHNPGPIEWHRLDAAKGIADLAAAARSILAASA